MTRLHPATPLLRGARMLGIAIAALSWQAYARLGPVRWGALTALLLVILLVAAAVSWLVTGYQLVGRELRISEGLLWRRTRAIPLERLQAVDVVRPLLARLAGVAELRLEVIGAHRTEAPLAYLSVAEAVRLRERLLALAGAMPAGVEPAPAESAAPGERVLHAVSNRQLLLSQLLTPHLWVLPVALVLTVVPYAQHPQWSFVAVGSMITAVLGVVLVPARRVLDGWHFRVGLDPAGLRLRHGLLSTRNHTVPTQRVQAVELVWPLLWRPYGWLHARVDVAGYAHQGASAGAHAGVLLPVADYATGHRVVAAVLGVDVSALPREPVPERARWRAPLSRAYLSFCFTDTVVAATDGWLTRRLRVVPLARVQSVRVVQGPLQRALRLASLHVDTAGGLHLTGHHRDVRQAYAWAAELADASRAARAVPAGSGTA